METSESLASQLQELRLEIDEKNVRLKELEDQLQSQGQLTNPQFAVNGNPTYSPERPRYPLVGAEYQRYGRQMTLPEVGLQGQLKLKAARVLIVGLGGLGCPSSAYLAGAGVGTIGLVDGDTVEVSNLQRQILHRSNGVGKCKVDSAVDSLRQLNPNVKYIPIRENLTPPLAASLFPDYDLILDCTDRPSTRYLVSDAAVLTGRPLVSASAVKTEGQLIVLNCPPRPPGDGSGSPCYRCIFPRPPPPETVTSCADGGILGPVVGTMGVLQALEAIKVIITSSPDEAATGGGPRPTTTSMLVFSAYSPQQFRNVAFRKRKGKCRTCGENPEITLSMFEANSLDDYVTMCGVVDPVNLLSPDERISPEEYRKTRDHHRPHVLIDTREKAQFDLCHLQGSVNVPIDRFRRSVTKLEEGEEEEEEWMRDLTRQGTVYLVCRMGNDSQEAVKMLKRRFDGNGKSMSIRDIKGGLHAWREKVDPEFPDY